MIHGMERSNMIHGMEKSQAKAPKKQKKTILVFNISIVE